MTAPSSPQRLLVIKLGALGDFILAFSAFEAIRRHHDTAHITLLTTPPYAPLAADSGWFDAIEQDRRLPFWRLDAALRLRHQLRRGHFHRVYDLQTSDRSGIYFHLMGRPRPEWSGIVRGCSHRHDSPTRPRLPTVERHRAQLRIAGLDQFPIPDPRWLDANVSRFALPPLMALLIPGCSPHRPMKRWPAERYGALAHFLVGIGITPLAVGTNAESDSLSAIATVCPETIVLKEETTLPELAALARRSLCAIGNDTGPMHLAAAVGCPTLTLCAAVSDPALCRPIGPSIAITLQRPALTDLAVETVIAALQTRVIPTPTTSCGS